MYLSRMQQVFSVMELSKFTQVGHSGKIFGVYCMRLESLQTWPAQKQLCYNGSNESKIWEGVTAMLGPAPSWICGEIS